MAVAESGARIGYILKAFPAVSETFILNEMRAMEAEGLSLVGYSLKHPEWPAEHRALDELEAPVHYAPSRLRQWAVWIRSHAACALRNPSTWASLARREVGRRFVALVRSPTWKARRSLLKGVRRFSWAAWVTARARRDGVCHLHAHYAGEPLRVAALARKLGGLSFSVSVHAKDLYTAPPEQLARRLAKAELVATCHGHAQLYVSETLGAEVASRILPVCHGIDTRLFRPDESGPIGGRLVAVGRLTPKKGLDVLLRACSLLEARGVLFELEIRGEGREGPRLRELTAVLGLDHRVRFAGFVGQEALPELYRRAVALVLPARVLADGNRDGVPNVVREAMACGTPVVGTILDGLREAIVDGESGLLVAPDDPECLARALERVLCDRELRDRLGACAARTMKRLDFRDTNRTLAARFRELLPVSKALRSAGEAAWKKRGMAAKAQKMLHLEARREPSIEGAIARAVEPGLRANAWRPDLERLASRRLWDEVIKVGRLPRLQEALDPSGEPGGRVLDLGSGRGGLSVALRARGHRVVALDLRYRNCVVAAWRGRRYALSVPAVTSVGEQLPFPDDSFQVVCCLEVLEHVRDPRALLGEIRRVLAPGGACALTVINRWAHLDPHYHLWGVNYLPRRLANAYIALRRRTKHSFNDCQTLDEMHYYRWTSFLKLAREHGFELFDPQVPEPPWRRRLHGLGRHLSLGFNSCLVVLRPI